MLNPPLNQKPGPRIECYPERTHVFELMKDEKLQQIIQVAGDAFYDERDQTVVIPKSGIDYLLEFPGGKTMLASEPQVSPIKIEILSNFSVNVKKGKVYCTYHLTQDSSNMLDLSEAADFILTMAEEKSMHVVVGADQFGAAFFDLPAEIVSTGSGVAVVPPIQGNDFDRLHLSRINKNIKTPEGGLRRDQMYIMVSGRQCGKTALFEQLRELINTKSEAFVDCVARTQNEQQHYRAAGISSIKEDAAVEKLSQPYKKKNNTDALLSRRSVEIARRARLLASYPFGRK